MGLLGIAFGLLLLLTLAFRSWSVLLLAPAAALVAAVFAGEPLLAHWTQTFMGGTARFLAQFFPIFLLGALFGKLMDDSGSVTAIADYMTLRLGERRAILAVVLAGALVTYGGVSLFVAFFVLAPMAQALFRAAAIPRRLMPAAIALGTSTFTMSALPGTPAIQNAIPMPFFGTTPFAAPGLGVIASAIMLGFGLWWLGRARGVRQARPAARLRPPGTAGRSVQAGRRPPPSLDGAGGPMPLRRPPKHPDRNMRSGSVISQVMPSASQSIRALPLHP
jgi:H+/gluconate symporter-like permease